jgi:hypothetical protein
MVMDGDRDGVGADESLGATIKSSITANLPGTIFALTGIYSSIVMKDVDQMAT